MAETFFSPCPRGLEAALADELNALGAAAVEPTHGGVGFRGDWTTCYRVNLESRIATRVLWKITEGRYRGEEDIYRIAYAPTWARWFTPDETIRVYVTAQRSPLKSLEFVTLRIKDAVCDHFRSVSGRRPSVDTANPDVRVHAFLTRDAVTLYLDASGEPLYKRGFKRAAVEAPLKENLAAGILRLAGWTPDEALVDPMCGSGTFLIEAAQIALDVAPGLGRRFGFEKLRNFDRAAWAKLRADAEARRKPPRELAIYGSDIVAEQVRRAGVNLEAAGLKDCVRLMRADILELDPPAGHGVMVTNPPYGVRIGERDRLRNLFAAFGRVARERFPGWLMTVLSADRFLEAHLGLPLEEALRTRNGGIPVRVLVGRVPD